MGGVSKWKPIRGQEAEEPEEETNQDKQMQPNWDSSGEGREEVGAQGGKSQKRSQSTLVTAVLWCSSPYHETVRRASPLGTGGEGGDKGRE